MKIASTDVIQTQRYWPCSASQLNEFTDVHTSVELGAAEVHKASQPYDDGALWQRIGYR